MKKNPKNLSTKVKSNSSYCRLMVTKCPVKLEGIFVAGKLQKSAIRATYAQKSSVYTDNSSI